MDPAWRDLAPWSERVERDEDGAAAFCFGLAVDLYFREGHTEAMRQAVVACFDDFLTWAGGGLRWWVVDGRSFGPIAKLKSRDLRPYLLSSKWSQPAAYDAAWAFLFHGGERKEDASPLAIEGLGAPRRDSELGGDLSYLRVSVPIAQAGEDPDTLIQHVLRWCECLRPHHGYGGITIMRAPDDGLAQLHEQAMVRHAARHPGLELDVPLAHSLATTDAIKGGSWITILGESFVERLGGAGALRDQLGTDFALHAYSTGAVVVSGPAPELGDTNRAIDTPRLRQLSAVLRPIRVQGHPPIHATGKLGEDGAFDAWLARFD